MYFKETFQSSVHVNRLNTFVTTKNELEQRLVSTY